MGSSTQYGIRNTTTGPILNRAATAGIGGKLLGGLKGLIPTDPVTAAIAAGSIALPYVLSQFGKGRKKADEFVQSVQDPFSQRIQAIFDPVTEARKAGTLTYDQASTALDKFNAEVTDFTQAQKEFEALGGDYATVAGQSRKTIDPLITQWRADLQAHLDAMPKPETPPDLKPEDAPTLDTILGQTTPGQAASRAAARQRQAAMTGGRQSTLLAGRLATFAPPSRTAGLRGY